MRTKTFDSIVELLRDTQWHSRGEVAEKTRYADEWIAQLRREAIVETEEMDGQTLVRLRADVASLEPALTLN